MREARFSGAGSGKRFWIFFSARNTCAARVGAVGATRAMRAMETSCVAASPFHVPFHVPEVDNHPAAVELVRLELDLDQAVVAVGVGTGAVVVEQPVTVAEVDLDGDMEGHAISLPPSTTSTCPVTKSVISTR